MILALAANVTIGAGDYAKLSDNGEDVITVTGLTSTTKEDVSISSFDLENDKLVLSKIKLADLTFTSLSTSSTSVGDYFKIGYGSKKVLLVLCLISTSMVLM